MQQPQNEHVPPVWKELCSHFRKNRLFRPWRKEFKLYLLGVSIDQITLHQQCNIAWKNATDLLQRQPTTEIQTLDELAKVNLVLSASALSFYIWRLTMFAVLLAFLGFSIDHLFNILSLGYSWEFREEYIWISVLLGAIFVVILILLLLTWISKQRALEISSCIQVELALRQSTHRFNDGVRPPAEEASCGGAR